MSTTEYKLLSTIRQPQHYHIIGRIKNDLFTDDRKEVFEAMQIALRKHGTLSSEAIEYTLGRELPPQMDVVVNTDPIPLIEELARQYKKRKMQELAQRAKELSAVFDPDLTELRDILETSAVISEADSSLSSGITEALSMIHAKDNSTYRYLDTGVKFLNAMFGGEWYRSELTIITGATGGGKTALMNTSALNMARMYQETGQSAPPAIFSLEMPKYQLVLRFLSDLTGMNSAALRAGRFPDRRFNDAERKLIEDGMNYLQKLPLYMFDAESMSADWIIAQTRELHRKHGVECIFIDYLQLMSYDNENKHYGLSEAGKKLRNFAKQLNIAVIALGQIHDDGRLRDVGDTDRDAGAILRITLDPDNKDDDGIMPAVFEVSKNRHGATGKYTGQYDSRHVKFI